MIIFKETHDLQQLTPGHPFNRIIREHFGRTGNLDGYLILIEKSDTHINFPELKGKLEGINWEGVSKLSGFYHAVYLTNNEFALEFIIPDREWLPTEIRDKLEYHLVQR